MQLKKYRYYKGDIIDLSRRFPVFNRISNATIKQNIYNQWKDEESGEITKNFTIAFFGKSGYGKSSTVNAFFGKDIMETSDIDGCTRHCNCIDYKISTGNYISISDFPGIGESEYRDQEYLEMYANFMDYVGVVVYIMRADARDHSIDEKAYKKLFKSSKDLSKVIVAINQCDKVEPLTRGAWHKPTDDQMDNIQKKINFIQKNFQTMHNIIPYSASTGWNINSIAEEIVKATIKSGDLLIH